MRVADSTRRGGVAVGLVLATIGWAALAAQFVLIALATHRTGEGWWVGASRFFGFFTILTNLLVVAVFTAPLMCGALARWLTRIEVRAATATYIAVVGLVYSAVLRQLWSPEGLQKIVDVVLHDVMPVAYVAHWAIFVARGSLQLRMVPRWLAYPLGYAVFALGRGALTGWYPYPFIDAGALGYTAVAINVAGLIGLFMVVALLVIGLDRLAWRIVRPALAHAPEGDAHA